MSRSGSVDCRQDRAGFSMRCSNACSVRTLLTLEAVPFNADVEHGVTLRRNYLQPAFIRSDVTSHVKFALCVGVPGSAALPIVEFINKPLGRRPSKRFFE